MQISALNWNCLWRKLLSVDWICLEVFGVNILNGLENTQLKWMTLIPHALLHKPFSSCTQRGIVNNTNRGLVCVWFDNQWLLKISHKPFGKNADEVETYSFQFFKTQLKVPNILYQPFFTIVAVSTTLNSQFSVSKNRIESLLGGSDSFRTFCGQHLCCSNKDTQVMSVMLHLSVMSACCCGWNWAAVMWNRMKDVLKNRWRQFTFQQLPVVQRSGNYEVDLWHVRSMSN